MTQTERRVSYFLSRLELLIELEETKMEQGKWSAGPKKKKKKNKSFLFTRVHFFKVIIELSYQLRIYPFLLKFAHRRNQNLNFRITLLWKRAVSYLTERDKGCRKEVSYGGIERDGAIELCRNGNVARIASDREARIIKLSWNSQRHFWTLRCTYGHCFCCLLLNSPE